MSQATADCAVPVSHVFVYGTLRRGGSNDINRLVPAPRFVATATVAGTLYDFGRYPGLVLGGAGQVQGEVYAVAPALVPILDEIEQIYPQQSDQYARREIAVEVARSSVICMVYEMNPRYLEGRPVIASGDWMAPRGV